MKKHTGLFATLFLAALASGCNLSAPAIRGSTPGPTPTGVPAADCPSYALDSIPADFAAITDPSKFIGKHYNPEVYYAAFGGPNEEMLDEVHALEQFYNGTRAVDFLERLVCRNSDGKMFFEVKDALILNLGKEHSFSSDCWAGEQRIDPVLAYGHMDVNQAEQVIQDVTGRPFDRVDFIYRIDLKRETFAPVPTKGVICLAVLRI